MTNRRSRKRRGLLANHSMCRKILPVIVLTVAYFWLQSVDAKQTSERNKQANIPNRSSPESDQQQELFQKSNITSSQANADYVTTTASYSTSSSTSTLSSSASKNPQLVSTATPILNHTLSGQTTPQAPLTSTSTAISTLLATAETPSSTTTKSNTVLSTTSPNLTKIRDNVVTKQWQIQKQQQPSARQQVVYNKQQQQQQQRNEGIQANSINLEPIDQMSTSQSVSFAEPMMAASNPQESRQRQFQPQVVQQQQQPQAQQQQPQQQLRGGNRWTHFGARLKPLTTISSDHHGSDSKSLVAIALGGQNNNHNSNNNNNNNMQQQQQRAPSVGQPLNGNQVGDQEDNEDLDDDDQDSEALLYKMMQQQGFLTGSIWQQQPQQQSQQQQQQVNGPALSNDDTRVATGNQLVQDVPSNSMVGGNSKKVIKLLKSYSHIHQVDDSDDQIRGTYTKVPAYRLNNNGLDQNNNNNLAWRGQQPKQQNQYNRNRLNTAGQQQQSSQLKSRQANNQIFVSSQPLARAYSQQTGRHQEVENYLPVQGGPNQELAYADGQENNGNIINAEASQDGGDQGGQASDEDDFECPNNGIFADEASGCQSYHVCQSGAQVQQKFQCPMGTLFNNIILTCDFAHNVQCKGKAQQEAAKAQSVANEEPVEQPVYRQPSTQPPQRSPVQQQVPRASLQIDQASYVNNAPQQARWSGQAQPQQQGPRQLRIGSSQYSQHQQNQQSSLAQAVSAYPHPHPHPQPTAHANNNHNNDDSDDDDDPIEPLIPATLPPARVMPAYTQAGPSVAQANNYQSAHRAQYPAAQQQQVAQNYNNKQNVMSQQGNYPTNGYDGDSAASPVFVSRDEPRTTEATINTVTNIHSELDKQQQPQQGDAQSFNLVINHLAPTRQQQSPLKNTIIKQQQQQAFTNNLEQSNSYSNKKPALQSAPKQNQLVAANQQQNGYTGLIPTNEKRVVVDLKQQPKFTSINNKLVAINAQAQAQAQAQNQQHQQQQQLQRANQLRQYANQNSYRQASQPKSIYVDAQPVATATAQKGTTGAAILAPQTLKSSIVDLTNDKRASVSSEALNDGLLLIVRHGTSIQSGGGDSQSYNKGSQQQVSYKPNGQTVRQSGKQQQQPQKHAGGQAFAIDPAAVRSNSPIDAQLFPNVQRVLAASQPSVSHQAPLTHVRDSSQTEPSSSSQHLQQQQQQQHVAYKKQHTHPQPTIRQEIRVSPPLPPMEPPKPSSYTNNDHNSNNNDNNDINDQYSISERASGSEAVQVVASSSHSQTSSTTPAQPSTVAIAAIASPSPPTTTATSAATTAAMTTTSTSTTATSTTTNPSQPALTSQNKKVSSQSKQQQEKQSQIKFKPKRLKAQQPPPTQAQKPLAQQTQQQQQRTQANNQDINKTTNIQKSQKAEQSSFGNHEHQLRRLESGHTIRSHVNTNNNNNKRHASQQ